MASILEGSSSSSAPVTISWTTVLSLFLVLYLICAAYTASTLVYPREDRKSRFIFSWLVFDALTHFILEGSFIWTSTFGRSANTGSQWPALLWQEYAKADFRWGTADETVVSLELLTVFIAGPLAVLIAYLMATTPNHPSADKRFAQAHFCTVILSTMELYGGAMTFFPEWITGSLQLRTDNFLHCWVYLFLMNTIWVVIPIYLLFDSYKALTGLASTRTKVH